MEKRNWKFFGILTVLIGAVMLIFDWRMTLGFVLGTAVSACTYFLTERFCDTALSLQSSGGTMGHFILNYIIWAAALILCAKMPQVFNILTCALGLFMIKISLLAGELFKQKSPANEPR